MFRLAPCRLPVGFEPRGYSGIDLPYGKKIASPTLYATGSYVNFFVTQRLDYVNVNLML